MYRTDRFFTFLMMVYIKRMCSPTEETRCGNVRKNPSSRKLPPGHRLTIPLSPDYCRFHCGEDLEDPKFSIPTCSAIVLGLGAYTKPADTKFNVSFMVGKRRWLWPTTNQTLFRITLKLSESIYVIHHVDYDFTFRRFSKSTSIDSILSFHGL